ncbi:MAG: matrixin family metalloprotease [Burkholderiales bacterium]
MATVYDLQNAPVANANWIDALLNSYPAWNYITPFRTTLYYTFSITSGTETQTYSVSRPNFQAFNAAQQAAAREIMAHAAAVTGIDFVETASGSNADIHFASYDISGPTTSGIASSYGPYSYNAQNVVTSYAPEVYIYLDNREFLSLNSSPVKSNQGYEVLLHEVGHALGLKHPFEGAATLPAGLDDSSHTVMSYTHNSSTSYSTFRELDLAALTYLYGLDGLGGSWGVGTSGYYYQGTSGNETFTAGSGRHAWAGLGGTDVVNYPAAASGVMFSRTDDSAWLRITGSGFDDWVAPDVERVGFQSGGTALPVAMLISALGTAAQRVYAGTSASDVVSGTGGGDLFYLGDAGNDIFDGAGGVDTALLDLGRAQVQIEQSGVGYRLTGAYGSDTLIGLERLRFNDKKIALDFDGAAGNSVKLIGAIFGKNYVAAANDATSAAYVGAGLQLFDSGMTVQQVAELALGSGVFPGGRSNANVVTQLYKNVTNTLPGQADLDYFVGWLDSGLYTQAALAVFAAESDLNKTNIDFVGLARSGIEYA